MTETSLTATFHHSIVDIPASRWNALAPGRNGRPDNPFHEHAFFKALEESGCATAHTGWQAQHIVLSAQGEPVGLMPLFLKNHSMGEYVFDHAWAHAIEQAGGHYYPKLQGSVPFTPAIAEKLLVPTGHKGYAAGLLAAAGQLAEQREASSVHLTFLPPDQAETIASLGWLHRTDTQFHWYNRGFSSFEEFLETLSSRKRKTIRRERREALADGLSVKWLTGADLREDHWDAFYAFYEDTGSRKWGRPYLNRTFFSLISQFMADRIVLMLAYDGPIPIAGALNFLGRTRLFGRNWGAVRDVPFLHFELCYYQAVDFAIAHKLDVVEAGAQGEHKLARGYEPTTTHSVHWISHPGLRGAVADYLARERRSVEYEKDLLARFTPFRKDASRGEHD